MKLIDIIHDEVRKICFRGVQSEEQLLDSGLLDSISLLELISAIEARLNINIPLSEINPSNFNTVSAIELYLSKHFKTESEAL